MPRSLEGFTLLPGKNEMQSPLSPSILTQHQPVLSLGTSFSSSVCLSLIYEELGEITAGLVLFSPTLCQPARRNLPPPHPYFSPLHRCLACSRLSTPSTWKNLPAFLQRGTGTGLHPEMEGTTHHHPCLPRDRSGCATSETRGSERSGRKVFRLLVLKERCFAAVRGALLSQAVCFQTGVNFSAACPNRGDNSEPSSPQPEPADTLRRGQ